MATVTLQGTTQPIQINSNLHAWPIPWTWASRNCVYQAAGYQKNHYDRCVYTLFSKSSDKAVGRMLLDVDDFVEGGKEEHRSTIHRKTLFIQWALWLHSVGFVTQCNWSSRHRRNNRTLQKWWQAETRRNNRTLKNDEIQSHSENIARHACNKLNNWQMRIPLSIYIYMYASIHTYVYSDAQHLNP